MAVSLGHRIWYLLFVLLVFPAGLHPLVSGVQEVPCYFIFGDSFADSGNNNGLATVAKANFPPYGIDFPRGFTGRFCNGRTMVDIIAELLGFGYYMSPFATAVGRDILRGVNYASGAAGIRSESGQHLGARISMEGQLQNHLITASNIANIFGDNYKTADYLSKCIYSVGMGSNDYINNYFLPQLYPGSRQYTLEQFAIALTKQYSLQLQALYNIGARKVALFGLGQLGCSPYALANHGNNTSSSSCVDSINDAVQIFNNMLKSLVDNLNKRLKDAKFVYVNTFGMTSDTNPSSLGFKVTRAPCCEVRNGMVTCVPVSIPCDNTTEYLYWDALHPTEAFNMITARRSYNAQSPSDAYPIDIHHLALL